MAEVRIHETGELKWDRMGDLYPAEMAAAMNDADRDSTMRTHELGADGSLHLQEFEFLPGAKVDLHAHDLPEIIYVVSGTLHFGNRELAAGSSAYVGAETLYAFTAGSEGARILVFMADGRAKYWFEDDFKQHLADRNVAAVQSA